MRNQLNKITLSLLVMTALAFTLSCSSDDSEDEGSGGNGNIESVEIGNQVWMKKNLDVEVVGSRCYNDLPANCEKYGRLYNWAAAMGLPESCNTSLCTDQIHVKHKGICPDGWHLPTNEEWIALVTFVNGISELDPTDKDYNGLGKRLMTRSGWDINGLDTHDFSALPGGAINSSGDFRLIGEATLWWSATIHKGSNSYITAIHGGTFEFDGSINKVSLCSVRCIKD